jgi:hypothetical protein
MGHYRFGVKDGHHQRFGELIKEWARGQRDLPKSIAEFRQVMEEEGIEAHFPTGDHELLNLNIFHGKTETLDIRLPPVGHLDESLKELKKPGATYDIPKFYHDAFGSTPVIPNNEDFHSARIGDYTIANCI